MPELPDVEVYKKLAENAINHRIEKVSTNYDQVNEITEQTIKKHLQGNKFSGIKRHGKQLFISINDGNNLVLHFGMTGQILQYDSEAPKHTALDIRLANGNNFAVTSVRKLGKIDICKDIDKYLEDNEIGPDALELVKEDFAELFKGRGYAKSTLMNQKKISGIGNIYSDEILYHAGIHPKKENRGFSEKDITKLYETMKDVLKTAADNEADVDKMPDSYLLGRRVDSAECGICGGKIVKEKISGRGSYHCNEHQKK
ncbi:MAG: DNA-formamidopyrimidine glycosylase family protein [Candidatus Kapaibacterium sp.]